MTQQLPSGSKLASRRILVMALAMVVALAFALAYQACHNPRPERISGEDGGDVTQSAAQTVVYFSKSAGNMVVTEGVVRAVPPADRQQPLPFAVKALLNGPTDSEAASGYYSEIPKGVRLLSVRQVDGRWRVNLSRQFTAGGGANSMELRLKQLQRTIAAAEKRAPTFVDIEGKQLDVLGGEGLAVQEPLAGGGVQP